MPTPINALVASARGHLIEPTPSFWTDAELTDLAIRGIYDLWRTMIDLHQEHFFVTDSTNVSLVNSTSTLAGVPVDVYRVLSIEPRDLSSTATTRSIRFQPADYQSPYFMGARSQDALDPNNGGVIFYAVTGGGPPVGAPIIYVAPQITTTLNLRLVYIPVLPAMTGITVNPIPGQSDHALIAWIVAYARAKERDDRSPDPNWLAIYATEKTSIMTASTPRQEQEPRVVRGIFDDAYNPWYW